MSLSFGSVRKALEAFWERAPSLQAPNGQSPRGEQAPDGSMVVVDVQGGRGSQLDEYHVTYIGIAKAMAVLEREQPVAFECLCLNWRDGVTMDELAKRAKCSQATVSGHIGRAESFLLGWLRRDGTIRGVSHAA